MLEARRHSDHGRDWIEGKELLQYHIIREDLISAFKDQTEIEWNNFLLGLASKKWAKIQNGYLKKKENRQSGRRWLIQIFKKGNIIVEVFLLLI